MRWRLLNQICFFFSKRRIADDWRDVESIRIDLIIATPNLYNIFEVPILEVWFSTEKSLISCVHRNMTLLVNDLKIAMLYGNSVWHNFHTLWKNADGLRCRSPETSPKFKIRLNLLRKIQSVMFLLIFQQAKKSFEFAVLSAWGWNS